MSKETLHHTAEIAAVGIAHVDSEDRLIYVNRKYCEMLGYSRNELLGRTVKQLSHPDDRDITEGLKARLRIGEIDSFRVEKRYLRKDGSTVWVQLHVAHRRTPSGEPPYDVSVMEDISLRKQTEIALRQSEAKFRGIVDMAAEAIITLDEQQRILTFNPAAEEMFGYRAEEVLNQPLGLLIPERFRAAHTEHMRRFQRSGVARRPMTGREVHGRRKDGTEFVVEAAIAQSTIGENVLYSAVLRDTTEQVRAKQLLQLEHAVARCVAEAEEMGSALRAIIEAVCDTLGWDCGRYFHSVDYRGELVCSQYWTKPDPQLSAFIERIRPFPLRRGGGIAGQVWETQRPMWVTDIANHPSLPSAAAAILAEAGIHVAFLFPLVWGGSLTGMLVFNGRENRPLDERLVQCMNAVGGQITHYVKRMETEAQRRSLEWQLHQVQKLKAIGTLASGIAHEFNNTLGAILANVGVARIEVGPEHPALESLDEIEKAGWRGRDLVGQILGFARPRAPQRRTILSLHDEVRAAVKFLRASLPAKVEVYEEYAADSPRILGDPTQVHQVLINLCTNAWQAMDSERGEIRVHVDGISLEASAVGSTTPLKPGRYARLSVTDSGKGMDPAVKERIFDPFFSTKPISEGTGLGLTVVHGIVQAHGGGISVESEPGKGTRLDLYFPAEGGPAESRSEGAMTRSVPSGSPAVIFYLDDDEDMVGVMVRILSKLGYQVRGYTSIEKALEAIRAEPRTCDLFVSDYDMPKASGLDVAVKLLRIRPDLPVAMISGYMDDELQRKAQQVGVRAMLYQPVSLEDMQETIAALTREPVAGPGWETARRR